MTELETSVRDQIALYVEDYISADRLNDLLPDTWQLDELDDDATTDLVMLVLGYLAEYQGGYRPEEELRAALAKHASWSIDRTASSVMVRPDLEVRTRVGAGTPLLAVHA